MPKETLDSVIDPLEIESIGEGPPPPIPEPPFGPDDDDDGDFMDSQMNNAYVGMVLFIGAEVMLFAGLIGAFLLFRFGSAVWPPPFQPRLPVFVTGINTAILLLSGYTMHQALQAIQNRNYQQLANKLLVTACLGLTFLVIQGYEWIRLIRFGLTPSSGVYGSTFYVLIGTHGTHVLGAVIWLLILLFRVRRRNNPLDRLYFMTRHYIGVKICGMYWYFVVALWPVLYTLVYLS
ncbi:MAG TPA: heme-copper oxidase subunit III [Candidatus Limnocylindrales bacterium]|nr:heme-copper oxidase subunit III [Candidatus Limnocylindrales bacterium]